MEKYNKKRKCPKCGLCETEDKYNDGYPTLEQEEVIGNVPDGFVPEESIRRTCKNCNYRWREKPLS